ncbi:MAG: tetratricopeptide repeat protein [Armatimonadota bacterium]
MALRIRETPSNKWPGYSQPERIMYLGRALVLSRKRPKTAEKLLQLALEMNPDFVLARQALIELCCQAKWFEKADTWITEYRELYPDDPNADLYQGWLFFVQKQYDQAEPLLKASLERSATVAFRLLDDLYAKTGSREKSARLWQPNPAPYRFPHFPTPEYISETPTRYDARAVRKRLKANPNDVEAILKQAEYTSTEGSESDADKLYQRAIEIEPDNPTAHYLYAKFIRYWYGHPQRESKAFERFMAAAKLCPTDPVALYDAGDVRLHMAHLGPSEYEASHLTEAQHIFEQALKLKPDFSEAHFHLGMCLSFLGFHDQALSHFDQVKDDFQYPVGYWRLRCLCVLGRTEETMEALVAELSTEPGYEGRRLCAALVEKSGYPATALSLLEDECIIQPTNPYRHWYYAACLQRSGRERDANAAMKRAFGCKPTDPNIQQVMGHFLKEMGHPERAEEWYKKAKDHAD